MVNQWSHVSKGGELDSLLGKGWLTGYVIFAKSIPASNDPKGFQDYALIFDPSSGTIFATGKGFASKVEILEPVLFYETQRDTVYHRGVRWPKAHEPHKMPPEIQEEWILNPAAQLKGVVRDYSEKDEGYKIFFDLEGRKVAQTFILKGRKVELLKGAGVVFSARKIPNKKGVYVASLELDPAAGTSLYNRPVLASEVICKPQFQESHVLLGFGNGAINQGGVNPYYITEFEAAAERPLSLDLMIQKYHWDIYCALRIVSHRLAQVEPESFNGIYLIGSFQNLSNRYLELLSDGIKIDIQCSFATISYWIGKVEEHLSRKPEERNYGVVTAHIFQEVPVGTNASNIHQRGVLGFLNADTRFTNHLSEVGIFEEYLPVRRYQETGHLCSLLGQRRFARFSLLSEVQSAVFKIVDIRLGIIDNMTQPLESEPIPVGAGPEGVLITFHLKVSHLIERYLIKLKEFGIHLAPQIRTILPDGWGSVLVYGGSEAQVEVLRDINISPDWEDWATAMPCSALFREMDPLNKRPAIINLSLNSKFAIDHSFIREIFKHAAYNWITPFEVRVFTGFELTVEEYTEIIRSFIKQMERKDGMGKSVYGNAVHSITGNGKVRCLINPPLMAAPNWGTAIPADLAPPGGLTQGVFVLGLSPDLGVSPLSFFVPLLRSTRSRRPEGHLGGGER
jgi:hypothetical protein